MKGAQQSKLTEISDENTKDNENKNPVLDKRIQIFTIGFTQKRLKEFIMLLKKYRVEKVVDIRLRPYGQLAGYSNKEDLKYVLEEYEGIKYQHEELLSPTKELLNNYQNNLDWKTYEKKFNDMLRDRKVERRLKSLVKGFTRICLLCSEDKPDKCHRRLVAEYFLRLFPGAIEILHITKDNLKGDIKIDKIEENVTRTTDDATLTKSVAEGDASARGD